MLEGVVQENLWPYLRVKIEFEEWQIILFDRDKRKPPLA